MSPLTTWLSEAPRLVAVPMAPLVRLNRPVENLNGDQRDGIRGQCVQHAANRQHAEPDHEDPLPAVGRAGASGPCRHRHHDELRGDDARRHVERRAMVLPQRQDLSDQGQHRGIREVK